MKDMEDIKVDLLIMSLKTSPKLSPAKFFHYLYGYKGAFLRVLLPIGVSRRRTREILGELYSIGLEPSNHRYYERELGV